MRHLWLYRQSYIDTVFLSRPIWNDSFNYIWTSMLKYRIHLSKLICWNKMPTRCNRGSYCRSYCLLNMFQASLCPSSVAQEYYTVVATCVIWCCAFQVVGLVWSWGLYVRFAGCCKAAPNTTGSNHCIILLSSWWWAWWCPKHVEQGIKSAIKTSFASSWHFIFTY